MEYSRPQADYFVESYDTRGHMIQQNERQKAYVNRQRQQIIAEELSELEKQEYREDIVAHMEQLELETLPDVTSIDIQAEIQWFMRPYLLDFLIEAHTAFGLLPETLFLTINILDRYCSKRTVYKRHYQLVGCAALLVAAKYGEPKDRVPTIRELGNTCCSLYDDDMFVQMERHVLQTLGWAIGHPTIDSFLQIALDGAVYDPELEHMACFISENALFNREFVSKRSSDIARSALILAQIILGRPHPQQGEWAAQYQPTTVVGLSQQLHHVSEILSRKYSSAHLSRVSTTLQDFFARQAFLAREYAAPPTPPCEMQLPNFATTPPAKGAGGPFQTPLKGPTSMPNMPATPPITPEMEYFGNNESGLISRPCPTTPTPMNASSNEHIRPQGLHFASTSMF